MSQHQSNILSIIVPVYNEKSTISAVIKKLSEISNVLEIIAVNDGSTDGSDVVLDHLSHEYSNLRVIHQPRNRGKTAALKTGFSESLGEIVIVQDADLEYDPQEICSVIDPIVRNEADVVYGSRFLVRKASRVLYFSHYLANKFLTFLSDLFTNINMTDVETCYKAFRGEIIRSMIIKSQGFGFEIEVTAKIAKLNCRIFEVPISYYGRTYEEGKKIGMKDGIVAIFYIFYFNLFQSLKQSFRPIPENYINKKILDV